MAESNHHACAVLLRGNGILIEGASGAGKTRLAPALARLPGGCFVADDQVLLSRAGDRLQARAPSSIFGLAEIRGLGPAPVPAEPSCLVDLVVRLVPAADAPRMRDEGAVRMLEACAVPRLDLPERDSEGAVLAVTAFLFGTPLGFS